MSRFINPYTDFGFKRLFGEEANRELLIDFLNSLLPEHHQIKTLEFRNQEQLGSLSADRKAIFDIYCEAENGERFIVEMQKAEQLYFKDRALFYAAFPIRDQGKPGKQWDFELKAVYFIGILDFEYDEEEEQQKFQRDVTLKDQDGDLFYDKLHFLFLQMPLFTKTESELKTQKDKWIYFLKNLVDFEEIPLIFRESIFERAFATAEYAQMSKKEQLQYESHLKVYRDNYAVMETAIFRAAEQAMADGRTEEKIEIARNMKNEGLDPTLISKVTGLSPEEIKRLS